MKTPTILSFFILLAQFSLAQTKLLKAFEIGITPVTFNTFNPKNYSNTSSVLDRPAYELVNGLFFRYTKNRRALRVLASYSRNSASISPPQGSVDGLYQDIKNSDLRIGLGAQYYLLKHWLYVFVDANYRNVFSTGYDNGGIKGIKQSFSQTANGIDTYGGMGFRIRLFKVVCISPEISALIASKIDNTKTTDLKTMEVFHSNGFDFNARLVTKLHLTVRF